MLDSRTPSSAQTLRATSALSDGLPIQYSAQYMFLAPSIIVRATAITFLEVSGELANDGLATSRRPFGQPRDPGHRNRHLAEFAQNRKPRRGPVRVTARPTRPARNAA